jgi:hypothetical protein
VEKPGSSNVFPIFASGMTAPEVSRIMPDRVAAVVCPGTIGPAIIATNAATNKPILLVIVLAPFKHGLLA